MIGCTGFVNGARAIGVEDDADANLTVFFLGDRAKGRGGETEEQGKNEAAHVLVGPGKVEGKAGEEKAKLNVERKVDRPLRRAMPNVRGVSPLNSMISSRGTARFTGEVRRQGKISGARLKKKY